MKTIARAGAVLSFLFFFIPGAWLALNAEPGREAGAVIFGMVLIGVAFFAGPMLWITGEKCGAKTDSK